MRKLNNPTVTVLMTAYNAEKYISSAIESILNQSYKDFEFIIVNDGSSDATFEIIKYYAKKDNRIRYVNLKENRGPSEASNIGINLSKGKYLARMDADDISFANRLEKQVNYLQLHRDVVMVGGQCLLINKDDEIIGKKSFPLNHKRIYKELFSINPIQHPSCMINMKLLPERLVLYGIQDVLAHDLELVFMLSKFGKLANLKCPVIFYRQYPNSLSLHNPKKTFIATLRVRWRGVVKYNYKPNFKSLLVSIIQTAIVIVLPNKLIYPIFAALRMKGKMRLFQFFKNLPVIIYQNISSRIVSLKTLKVFQNNI